MRATDAKADPGAEDADQDESASLLQPVDGEQSGGPQKLNPPATNVWKEIGPALTLGWPMVASQYLDRSAQQLCVMLIGHLGPEQLGAVVLATMWCNITGLSLVMGGMSGLNTLCAQAFGAGNYQRLGVLLQRAILMCLLLLIPIGLSWWFVTAWVLALIGIDPAQAELSASFAKVYLLVMPAMLTVQAIQTFFRAQRIVKPITLLSVVGAVCNVPIVYFCIERFGFLGAPLAQALGAWLLLLLYALYFGCTGLHKRCWGGWTVEALQDWGPLAKMGAAGTASMMGYLPKPASSTQRTVCMYSLCVLYSGLCAGCGGAGSCSWVLRAPSGPLISQRTRR